MLILIVNKTHAHITQFKKGTSVKIWSSRVSGSRGQEIQKKSQQARMWKTERENAIRVCVRVRPLNEKERQTSKDIADVSMKHNTITIKDPKDDQFDPVDVLHRSYEKVCYFIFFCNCF